MLALVAGDDYTGVIVPEAAAADFVAAAGWDEAIEFWTPAPDDVAALEEAFDTAWAEQPAAADGRFADPREHRRQYVGTIVDGRRLIEVNGFCDPHGTDWTSEPVVVLDGGACYYRATWDVDGGEFLALTVNGEA